MPAPLPKLVPVLLAVAILVPRAQPGPSGGASSAGRSRAGMSEPSPLLLRRDREGAVQRLLLGPAGRLHALAVPGARPKVVLAVPEGNAGAGLWLAARDGRPVAVSAMGEPRHEAGGDLRRARFPVEFATGELEVVRLAAGSIRDLRDFDELGRDVRTPVLREAADLLAGEPAFAALATRIEAALVAPALSSSGDSLGLGRPTLDGTGRIATSVKVLEGTRIEARAGGGHRLVGSRGRIRIEVRLEEDRPRLGARAPSALLTAAAAESLARLATRDPVRHRELCDNLEGLAFLATPEKLLAGSWRFLTYFGRDSLMTLRLLAPVLRPEILEEGAASVLLRVGQDGSVAHEEDLAEQAVFVRLSELVAQARRHGRQAALAAFRPEAERIGETLLDRKMIDDDLMLLPLLSGLAARHGPARVEALLARTSPGGTPLLDRLLRNAERVLRRSRQDRVVLEPGHTVGEWRDSNLGLGGGRAPFDVTGALLPAALAALGPVLRAVGAWPDAAPGNHRLRERARSLGLPRLGALLVLDRKLSERRLRELVTAWHRRREAFRVVLPAPEVRRRVVSYLATLAPGEAAALRAQTVPGGTSLAAFLDGGPSPFGPQLAYYALALRDDGSPVEVMHSDAAFLLLDFPVGSLDPDEIAELLAPFRLPFPLGLRTDAGILVANPGLSSSVADQALFDRRQYHGTVIWGWQMALLEAGLERSGHDPGLLAEIRALGRSLHAVRSEELWSWAAEGGRIVPRRYGAEQGSVTESNALQLWSLAPLANELLAPSR